MAVQHFIDANPFYRGVSATELGRLFGIDLMTVKNRIKHVVPCGKRGQSDLYRISDAAAYLVSAAEDETEMIERVLKMRHTDLPKMLSKEYWAAQTYKQKYEIQAGDLWPTTRVVEMAGEAFKTMRLSLQLMADTVEREEALSKKQRQAIQNLVDATLNDMRERLIDAFSKQRRDYAIGGSGVPQEENGKDEDL